MNSVVECLYVWFPVLQGKKKNPGYTTLLLNTALISHSCLKFFIVSQLGRPLYLPYRTKASFCFLNQSHTLAGAGLELTAVFLAQTPES